MSQFKIRKLANAFYKDAQPSALLQGPAKTSVKLIQNRLGGLWVGGAVDLTEQGISFKANALNDAFHEHLDTISIPANEIQTVHREFGWVTGIVVVKHSKGEFRFRCFNAIGVVNAYNTHAKRL